MTPEQKIEILDLYKAGGVRNQDLAKKYGVSEEAIRRITTGTVQAEPEPIDEDEKKAIEFRDDMLKAFKEEGIDPKLIACSLKKLLESGDNADVRDAVKEYMKVAGSYAKERKAGSGADGSPVIEKRYILKLPVRNES